jgi:hypothetical protein
VPPSGAPEGGSSGTRGGGAGVSPRGFSGGGVCSSFPHSFGPLPIAFRQASRQRWMSTMSTAGIGCRCARVGKAGKGLCGSVWYQYATEARSSVRLFSCPCSMLNLSDSSK